MPKKYELLKNPKPGSDYDISIWDTIEEYDDYEKLLEGISNIGKSDSVRLYISSPGGRCDVGFMLIERLLGLECPIEVIVPYPTYSMGAIMALCGDSLEVQPGGFLMFHDYSSGGGRSKGNEQLKHAEAYKDTFNYKFNSICQPFLSKQECKDILDGKDLYIKWNDASLDARIKRHFK
jgi:ATP-dependent protease ClpP protease subunit